MNISSDVIMIVVFIALFIVLFKVSVPMKKKRMIKRCERVQNNLNDKEVRKFISFVRTHTMIKTPDVAWALIQAQKQINSCQEIDPKYKLQLFKTLAGRSIQGLQPINTIYVDKSGNRV